MKNIVLFGPPGAGKGTQAEKLIAKYGLDHVSTGDVIRAEIKSGSELGKLVKSYTDKGELVPDQVVIDIIADYVLKHKTGNGNIFDGFPRNIAQANDLNEILAKRGESVTGVVGIMISDEVVRKRIAHRAAIEGRADDASDETITNRINTYHAQTEPLIAFYKEAGKYYECNGDQGSIADNRAIVLALVETIK